MIQDLKEEYRNVLLLDVGDFFWPRKLGELRTKTTAKAMKMMEYDALNVADGELSFGIDFLKGVDAKVRRSFVNSNISGREDFPWQACLIKTYNGLRVAILGVVSPDLVNHTRMREDGMLIEDPEVSLRRMLSDVREKTDLVVLMSHLGWEPTRTLIDRVSGIDIAIVGHATYPTLDPEKVGKAILLKNSRGGKHLGVVKLWLDDSKKIRKFKSALEELSSDIHIYPEYTLPETEFDTKKRELNQKKKQVRKKEQMMEKFKDWTKLSPEEFIEMMKREKEATDDK